ncbi:zinc finger CCCH domain-containing protein 7B-like [Parambassis ranga]|uniref:Zinc finger CCCH domain-containing protein 7B-like n=1 Tax=Parambassis ranga TaxID=210632 RepID=A0A6P7IVG4_9TELE|nr:zinc finger CCCH domain-containing protein 7B-like [Parambassis ranga]
MDSARQKRRREINKALTFIQSSLAYPEPDAYQDFLTQLVCNLLEEGNAYFKDRQWEQAIKEFSEGLNVSDYAEAEEIPIPEALLESLYVNRAAAYHSMGEFELGVQDCDSALEVCKDSRRALYRKALCLKGQGKHREAYNCTTNCLLITPTDEQVKELAQELTALLGLKIRKPYISTKESAKNLSNGVNPRSVVPPVSFPSMPQSSFPSPPPSCNQHIVPTVSDSVEALEDSELMGDDLDSLLDCLPAEDGTPEAAFPDRTSPPAHMAPPILPAPTPLLPPAFFSSVVSQLNSLDSFSGDGLTSSASTLDVLDDLSTPAVSGGAQAPNSVLTSTGLDTLDGLDDFLDVTPSAAAAALEVNERNPENGGEMCLDELDELDSLVSVCHPGAEIGDKVGLKALEQLDSLDTLDSFPSVEAAGPTAATVGGAGLDSLSDFNTNGFSDSVCAAAPITRPPNNHFKKRDDKRPSAASNPLSSTHDFLQACPACFFQEGRGIHSYVYKPDRVHECERDVLLCRRRTGFPSEWSRVRPMPSTSFKGPFVLCKNLLSSGDLGVCKFGEKCTFAYNQLEIDVWTEERKGALHRNLLFETPATKLDPVNSIIRLLQENKGIFIFLCQECYDSKPRIISKRCSHNHTICSNLDARHNFDANKCLAFVVRTHNVNYSKVRPLSVMCHLDLCRQAIRYGCLREDSCHYAHSIIELKTWRVQRDTGISPDEIVKVSMKFSEKQEENANKQKANRFPAGGGSKTKGGGVGGGGGAVKSLNMKMKFVCAQCWAGSLISEPDKALKYCSAKTRHPWTKERRLLLVKSPERSRWVQVRPLPHTKNFPMQYDLCIQILKKKKCTYPGNCTFAHSQEEKEMWMYMKNNELVDMQQMYDMWLSLTLQNRQEDGAAFQHPVPEEKNIAMPTDYAEPMSGFHCRLCGRHSNSERQWQQHVSSEKHKDRVFSCEGEGEDLMWNYRFPGARFELCPKLDGGCPDGVSCDFAHSPEELQEWTERRDFLRKKLARAREDMLIMPDECDFGKYNFLLQD